MPRRIRTSPRKSPRQERSKVTVDTIILAMTRVLIKDGWDAASTNRVAKEAGVSVGSLYQYFPSKEALVLAVMERHALSMTEKLQTRMMQLASAPLQEATAELVHLFIESHQTNPKLHRVLLEQVPKVGALQKLEELNRLYERLLIAYMEIHREDLEVKDLSVAAYVIVQAVEALCHHAVLERQDLLDNGKLEEQIVRLVLGYVKPSLLVKAQVAGRALVKKRLAASA
jgi:AcrR family transcriptional regulator